jgi:flagellar motor protein MotB
MIRFPQDYRRLRPDPARPSLKLNTPGDVYEQEAERMAQGVTPGPGASAARQQEAGPEVPAQVQEVVSAPGQPLDPATRDRMETRLGHDFSQVRVHADGKAAESARLIDALAYTSGPDVAFAAGRFDTASDSGQRLLAHELTHVVQQTGGGSPSGGSGLVQRQPVPGSGGSTDLRESASPLLASAMGSTTVDKFVLGSAKIPTAGEDSLRYAASQILYFLRKYPLSTVHLAGHTDTVDSESRNLALGQERADAVSAFLQKEGVPAEIISTESKGESDPVKPTKNGVAEPLNRRVNVFFRTTKSGISLGNEYTLKPPAAPVTAPPATQPTLTVPPGIINKPVGPPYRDPADTDLWDRMQENQRKIDELKSPEKKSVGDVIIDGVMDNAVKPILKKLPISDDLRKKAEGAIRGGLETGTEKGCEAAIDGLGLGAEASEGLKAACKAALKQKPK